MSIEGKGCFIWRIKNCEGGNPQAIAARAVEAEFTHVLVKIADGTFTYNYDWDQNVDLVPPLIQALKNQGIQVWGWHYVYGDAPVGEARKAIERLRELNLDGYVIDAEAEYKDPAKKTAARRFMSQLRAGLPDFPIALTSYRFPSYHPQLPWREFLEKCDFNMPQVYWEFNNNPAVQLTRCVREFQDMTPFRPILPIGPAYRRGSWAPTPEEVTAFLETTKQLNLKAASFWEWSAVRKEEQLPTWVAIRDYSWAAGPIPSDIAERYIAALNGHDPARLVALYAPNAAHVTSSSTKTGHAAIRAWYQSFFNMVLPNAVFTLTGYSGSGNSRHFSWTAISDKGEVQNGNDVFGLVDGRIVYHYTFFSVNPIA